MLAINPNEPQFRDERECPYCAERILKKVRVCKHCGRDVEPLVTTHAPAQAPPPARSPTAEDVPGGCSATGYSGAVLSSHTEIRQLREVARRFMQQHVDPMQDPEFFLASVPFGWRPRVVAINRGGEIAGIMYAMERVFAGIPSGIVCADGGLSSPLLGHPCHRQVLFRVAVESLLAHPRIGSVCLVVPQDSDDFDSVKQVADRTGLQVRYSGVLPHDSNLWKKHGHLALPGTYEEFLKGLGYTTRHNFRYYRRRFEAAGHRLVERLSTDALHSAVSCLAPKTKHYDEATRVRLETQLNVVATTDRQLAMGLRHQSGEWLSVVAGWYRPRGAVLYFQCNNDQEFGQYSLSLVLRGYLIEHLVRQKLEELVIWWGSGPPLSRYVTYVPAIMTRFDELTLWWRVTRRMIATAGPRLPKRWAEAARWFA